MLLAMSKAFDSIKQERLLTKLHNIGVSTPALTWFESYFTQRSQFVMMEDDILAENLGVPQGSILGPVLFTAGIRQNFSSSVFLNSCVICHVCLSLFLARR